MLELPLNIRVRKENRRKLAVKSRVIESVARWWVTGRSRCPTDQKFFSVRRSGLIQIRGCKNRSRNRFTLASSQVPRTEGGVEFRFGAVATRTPCARSMSIEQVEQVEGPDRRSKHPGVFLSADGKTGWCLQRRSTPRLRPKR